MCVVDLVPDNLKDVQDLVWDVRTKWDDLGLELGIKISDLEMIEKNCNKDVNSCFKKMLLMWLRMVDPFPSWEGLVSALGKSSVGRKDIAEKIRDSIATISPAGSVCDPAGQFIPPHSHTQGGARVMESGLSSWYECWDEERVKWGEYGVPMGTHGMGVGVWSGLLLSPIINFVCT